MAFSLWSWRSARFVVFTVLLNVLKPTRAFSSSHYSLDAEFLGGTFFDGWDFFTDADPTLGFVSYYDQLAARQAGLVRIPSGTEAVYIGVDHVNKLTASGAGRPSVRLTTKKNWTHGLFIGDFNHIPAGVCGTWPAFWTLGPDWPYTGEIDILEGVNDIETNSISLHTNETCVITGNTGFQSGVQGGTDCAVYPGQNVGCGVVDRNTDSYSNFNNVGGGVYAMQWTSDYIRVWFWARNAVPKDIIAKTPNPFAWGKPVANMESPNCLIDKHFQQHNIVIDTTFCGTYAGSVWPGSACQAKTGSNDCKSYVAANPQAFADSYWSINSIRVYQLVDPAGSNIPASLIPALHSTFIGTIPVTETYTPPITTLTTLSDGLNTTVTIEGAVSPTHPVFNTTAVGSGSIGPGMGTFTHARSTNIRSQSAMRMSTYDESKIIPNLAFDMIENSASSVSTQTVSATDNLTEISAQPSILANFAYAGCKGMSSRTQGLVLAETSVDMNVQRCMQECKGNLFAGIFGQYCFCGSELSVLAGFVDYPAENCNIPCPGNQDQLCGGIILPEEMSAIGGSFADTAGKLKRQAAYPPGSILLFVVYGKMDMLAKDTTTTKTEISTNTVISYDISTTWYDYCAICPDYRTTQSMTITVLHCGCTEQPDKHGSMTPVVLPTIPMVTTARNCACGEGGAASTTIVTIPCPSGIATLQSSLANLPAALPGVFMQHASSGASAQTVLAPTSHIATSPSPCPDTVTQTFTLQSMGRSATQFPTAGLPPVKHGNRINGPIIPIPARISGSFLSLRNASDTSIYNIPILSQPHPTASLGSPTTMTRTSGGAVPAASIARSGGTKTSMEHEGGIVGYLLIGLNVLVVGGMLVL